MLVSHLIISSVPIDQTSPPLGAAIVINASVTSKLQIGDQALTSEPKIERTRQKYIEWFVRFSNTKKDEFNVVSITESLNKLSEKTCT